MAAECERSMQLDAYVDGEMGEREQAEFAAHAQQCVSCATQIAARLRFKAATRAVGNKYRPSPEFRQRMIKQIGVAPKTRAWMVPAWSAALGLVVVVASWFGMNQGVRQRDTALLIDQHVTTLASSNPVDVISTDRHTVKPWFQGRLPFAFNLPELAGSDYKLLGGSMAYVNQAPAAHLVYTIRQHKISVFVVQKAAGVKVVSKDAPFTVRTVERSGLMYVFVSDAAGAEVDGLVRKFEAI
jgi:anti-sigma factor RsiW